MASKLRRTPLFQHGTGKLLLHPAFSTQVGVSHAFSSLAIFFFSKTKRCFVSRHESHFQRRSGNNFKIYSYLMFTLCIFFPIGGNNRRSQNILLFMYILQYSLHHFNGTLSVTLKNKFTDRKASQVRSRQQISIFA